MSDKGATEGGPKVPGGGPGVHVWREFCLLLYQVQCSTECDDHIATVMAYNAGLG